MEAGSKSRLRSPPYLPPPLLHPTPWKSLSVCAPDWGLERRRVSKYEPSLHTVHEGQPSQTVATVTDRTPPPISPPPSILPGLSTLPSTPSSIPTPPPPLVIGSLSRQRSHSTDPEPSATPASRGDGGRDAARRRGAVRAEDVPTAARSVRRRRQKLPGQTLRGQVAL